MSDSREKFEAWQNDVVNCHTMYDGSNFGVWQAAEQSRQAEIDALKADRDRFEVECVLYADDAKRCWNHMPDLENHPADFELHEAVHELVQQNAALKQCIAGWAHRSESCESKLGQLEANEELYALKQRIADAEKQEPVAWAYPASGGSYLHGRKLDGRYGIRTEPEYAALSGAVPLYTISLTPPDVAELKAQLLRQHAELLAIHKIGMCIAECPPISDTDTMTVKMAKGMAIRINGIAELQQKLSASEADVKMLCGVLEYYRDDFTGAEPSLSVLDRMADEALAAVRARKEG